MPATLRASLKPFNPMHLMVINAYPTFAFTLNMCRDLCDEQLHPNSLERSAPFGRYPNLRVNVCMGCSLCKRPSDPESFSVVTGG